VIFQFEDIKYRKLMQMPFMKLPKRWDGIDFNQTLKENLFELYIEEANLLLGKTQVGIIKTICDSIVKTIDYYYKGYPVKAYQEFSEVMEILIKDPIIVYQKSGWIQAFKGEDPLKLFRMRNVQNNTLYKRKDIFHTPYNLRSKVSSCRYSIAGYPSLYLGTSLALCSEETKVENLKDLRLTARFELVRNQYENGNNNIKVIELALKPQDFLDYDEVINNIDNQRMTNSLGRRFNEVNLFHKDIKSNYLCWYPLIAACSFMRVNKGDSFASEYIIPQLLMQWIRTKFTQDELYGIRYFSCASEKASDMGFNYVFPVSGEKYKRNSNFCAVIAKTFKLTKPIFTHEYETIVACETVLREDQDLHII
jgi:hypothetical protein